MQTEAGANKYRVGTGNRVREAGGLNPPVADSASPLGSNFLLNRDYVIP